jgi:two-component system chemotaxis response regulator CheB
MIRTLVVDDSSFMRQTLSRMLDQASDITVVDTAANGAQGVEKVREWEPDVVTMDVEMPKMDGITAVRHIMDQAPCPILMISSTTKEGAETTMEAMEAGAADFLPKGTASSTLQIREVEAELVKKVRALSQSQSRLFEGELGRTDDRSSARSRDAPGRSSSAGDRARDPQIDTDSSFALLAIGVSTGGPIALQSVLPALPGDFPVPVVVSQHMPPEFTQSLAGRLDDCSSLNVREAEDKMRLEPGRAVIAAGGYHLTIDKPGARHVVRTPERPAGSSHIPSVDVMLNSACDVFGGRILTLIMTGMGQDGLQGARRVKENGGTVFVQDEASSVVYGMPRVVVEEGLADAVLPLEDLSDALIEAVGTPARL